MFPSLQFFGKSYPTNIWSTHVYHVCKKYRYSCSYICMFLLVVLLLWLVKCVKLTFIAWGITEDQTVRTLVVIHSSNYIIHNIYIYFICFIYLFIYFGWNILAASLFLSSFSFPFRNPKHGQVGFAFWTAALTGKIQGEAAKSAKCCWVLVGPTDAMLNGVLSGREAACVWVFLWWILLFL